MKAYTYILECADGSFYTGATNDLEHRFEQHQSGKGAKYIKGRLPVKLAYCEEFENVKDAFYREKQIKRLSRKEKEELGRMGIEKNWKRKC